MPFGYIKDGQPVEIVSEAVIDDVAHSLGTLMLWTDEERAAIGVMPILPPDPAPEGQRLAGTTLEIVEGQLQHVGVYEDIPPPAVPTKVHKYWLVEELLATGRMASLRAVLTANDEARERWEASNEVYRNNPLVDWFAALQQMTPEEMDGVFIAAAARQAANTPI